MYGSRVSRKRIPPLVDTAYMAKDLGVERTTVLRYVRRGLLKPLFRGKALVFDGDEFARFKREEWPLLPRRRGRMPKRQTIASIMREYRMKRALRGLR